jgi:hypothetical protein
MDAGSARHRVGPQRTALVRVDSPGFKFKYLPEVPGRLGVGATVTRLHCPSHGHGPGRAWPTPRLTPTCHPAYPWPRPAAPDPPIPTQLDIAHDGPAEPDAHCWHASHPSSCHSEAEQLPAAGAASESFLPIMIVMALARNLKPASANGPGPLFNLKWGFSRRALSPVGPALGSPSRVRSSDGLTRSLTPGPGPGNVRVTVSHGHCQA